MLSGTKGVSKDKESVGSYTILESSLWEGGRDPLQNFVKIEWFVFCLLLDKEMSSY